MAGVRKLTVLAQAEVMPPANLWEVLERGQKDAFPIHTALWLYKNAQGSTGAFRYLPGPEFGYRVRDPKVRSTSPNNGSVTLQALAWFLCQPAYGQGHLAAGPTAAVYGSLADGFLVPPLTFPTSPAEFSAEVRDLLAQATFPLTDLPVMSRRHIESFFALMFMKSSCIFGPMESQLIRRAGEASTNKRIPSNIERDVQRATDRAAQAFALPSRDAWRYDQDRQEKFVKTVRCLRATRKIVAVDEGSGHPTPAEFVVTSPYSPPYWGLPIFDLRPFYQEALRLVKLVPENLSLCPGQSFMDVEDWRRLHTIVERHKFSKGSGKGFSASYPKNADENAAWDWIEQLYGIRVRLVLYPSDRRRKK